MMRFATGDILKTSAEALVNTVNCVGIMGRGVALQFKKAYPENFKLYEAACSRGEVQPGRMFVTETGKFSPRYIINFPTKRHWRGRSRIEDIESGLEALAAEIRERNIQSIAMPPLGSGLGGLDWADVRPKVEKAMQGVPNTEVIVFEPSGAPESQRTVMSKDVPNMTAGRAALVVLMHRYLAGLLDPFVTLLELHKLMFFMQEAGQPLRLRYAKAARGPYAENLRHVLNAVEGHLLVGYADGGDAPDKQLELVPGAIDDANVFLTDDSATRERFERVAALVDGFESPFGLELLATIYWVVKREAASTVSEVIDKVYSWNERKRRFSPRQIELALDALSKNGWLEKPRII